MEDARTQAKRVLDRIVLSETTVSLGTAILVGAGTGIGAVLFIRLIEFVQKILDLLQKSGLSLKLRVIDSSNQVEAQAETLTPIAIAITQNMKYLQSTNDVFTENSLPGQFPIGSFLFRRQRMKFRLLSRYLTVGMQFMDTQIAGVG